MPAPKTANFTVGKIPPASLLRSVLPFLGKNDSRIMVKAGVGRDAAVMRHENKVLVFSADPVTGTTTHIGTHSVMVNANDIATSGARPIWYLCTVLLPSGTNESYLRSVMVEIHEASMALGVAVLGGHTEVTPGLARPIIAGFMIGEAQPGRALSAADGRRGDLILLTKTAGIEGTAILASDHSVKLVGLQSSTLERARAFSKQISVVKEALAIAGARGVHAMHDPTEGGVLNGLWELSEASGLGIDAWADKMSIARETEQVCSPLGLDPLKLMSSGSLLVAVQPSEAGRVAARLRRMDVPVSEVGVLTARGSGRNLFRNGRKLRLRAVPRDELYRLG